MSTPPIGAEEAIAKAIYASLSPLMTAYQYVGSARCYYQLAPENAPMPFLVYQLQTDIDAVQRVGGWDAEAVVVLRAIAETPVAARALLSTVAPGMETLTVTGHHVQGVWDGAPAIPPSIGYVQAALRYRVRVRKTS
jgi:hypothetical protein